MSHQLMYLGQHSSFSFGASLYPDLTKSLALKEYHSGRPAGEKIMAFPQFIQFFAIIFPAFWNFNVST